MIPPSRGDQIRERLKRLGISRDELAKRFEVSNQAITYWIAGTLKSQRLDTGIPAFLDGVEYGRTSLAA